MTTHACAPASLKNIITDIAIRCGIEPDLVDASAFSDVGVKGLVLAGLYSGGDAIDALRRAYFFDPVEVDGVVRFVARGADPVATITDDDLVNAPEESNRGQALEFPRKVHLDYQNAEIGYAPAKATAARSSVDVRVTGEMSLEVPVVLTSDEAAQIADKLQKVAWADAEGEVSITLGDNWIRLTPTDVVNLALRGSTRRLRISRMERDSGQLRLTCKVDRQSAYRSTATGPVLRAPTPPPSAYPGQSTLAVMDLPALVDLNDSLGLYLAVSGTSTAYAGAQVQMSLDGGASFEAVADIRRNCRQGTLLTAITAASEHHTDTTNVLRVDFGTLAGDLPTYTDSQWLSESGALAILRGDGTAEIVQYRDAVPDATAGVWLLSPLIRGRLNTGATAHSAGARVVFLNDAAFVPLSASLIGQSLRFRAVSYGETPPSAGTDQTITFAGRSQIEFPVLDLAATQAGSTVTATWTRRDRFGTDLVPITSVNWSGYRVTFSGPGGSTSLDTTNTTAQADVTGFGTPITVTVAQINRITGAGPTTSKVI